MLLKVFLIAVFCTAMSHCLATIPSDTKVSIYDFCSWKVPCAPGHLCHEGFCIQQQPYFSFPRAMYYRSLFKR